MGTGMIGSSLTGINAAQLGLQTTEHNIANASTPGFSRQRTVQASNPGLQSGAGFIGQGTHVATIERMYSRFLSDQVSRSQASASELASYSAQIAQIDNMLADTSAGLSPALLGFFKGVQQVAANPSDLPSRQAMISSAQALSGRYQALGGQLAQIYDGVDAEVAASVAAINSYAEQIASLNERIGVAAASTGQPPNDLLDTRDRLVLDLNKLVKATTTVSSDGSLNVFMGSGQQLVVGSQFTALTTTPSASDRSRLVVALKTAIGVQEMPERLINGGSLGGLLAFRRESLDKVSNELGRNAASLALTFNAQSALGQDLLGQSQLSPSPSSFAPALFSLPAPAVFANATNPAGSPTLTAAFVDPPPYSGNFYTDLGSSDYRLSGDAAGVTLTRLSDNKVWAGADLAAINAALATDPQGFTLLASAGDLTGSSYLIQPTRNAALNISVNPAVVADARLIAAGGPVRTSVGKGNSGAAAISAGSVGPGYPGAVPLAAGPITLRFQDGKLLDFPAGAQVSINGGVPAAVPVGGLDYRSGDSITLVDPAVVSVPPSGFTFTISGLPNNGDTFVIARNTGGTADARNALALGQLQVQNTMSGKTATYQDAYAQLVSQTGSKTRQIQVSGEAQQALLEQAQASRDSLSAVNLDEEAANLIRYQQAYQASAKALQIGANLFETILQLGS